MSLSTTARTTVPPSMASLANMTPALTTTFVPKATTCTENRLTMLANRGFQIWMNEPLPVPGSTFSACYPSQFMQSYTLLGAKVTQPAFNPLVCPQNYETIGPYTSNYIACCPSGYKLADPTANPFKNRPAFGGTCYTPIEMATPVLVTAYGSSGPTATITYSATATNAQAYAHPYEGFAFGVAQVQSIVPSATTTDASSTSSPAPSTSPSAAATYTIKADDNPVFNPNTINARIGDTLIFEFDSGNHTITQSSFDTPCSPIPNGIDSGYMPKINDAPPEFSVLVTTTTPQWFYSKQSGDCGNGMTFALNPSTEQSQAKFQQAAITQNSPSKSGLSSKAKVGIGLGIGIPALLVALFAIWFFLFRRRRQPPLERKSSGEGWETNPTVEYYQSDAKADFEDKPKVPPKTQEVHGHSFVGELPAYEPVELDGGERRDELESPVVSPQSTESRLYGRR